MTDAGGGTKAHVGARGPRRGTKTALQGSLAQRTRNYEPYCKRGSVDGAHSLISAQCEDESPMRKGVLA